MNIYFSCSITGGRSDEAVYQALVARMQQLHHEVPTAHLSDPKVLDAERIAVPRDIYERDMNWLRACDVVVAEVSTPSHGVGYEIAVALLSNKPVFCCYQKGKRVSKIITGNTSPTLKLFEYESIAAAEEALTDFLTWQETRLDR